MYLKKNYLLMGLIPLVLSIIIMSCEQRLGVVSPPSISAPLVSATNPGNAAIGVPINQKIAATFSVPMDATTITTATFTLRQGNTAVAGFVSYTGVTAIFAPSTNLEPNTAYTAMLTRGAKDTEANALVNNYMWTFTTGENAVLVLPTISSTAPANSATNVALNQKVAATFSTTMDATTITSSTFTLTHGSTSVSGFVSYTGTTALFSPAVNLEPNTLYTATITTGAEDLAGNALASDNVWLFTTGATVVNTAPLVSSTDPANAAVGVALNQKISANFSTGMNATTVTAATFTLTQGTEAISSFVSYSGTTALLAPANNLLANTTYNVTITTGAEDLAGNALAANYAWSFTTGTATIITPPTVSATDPADGAVNVALNQQIAASFSKTMDATTITGATFTLLQDATPVSGFISYSGTSALFSPATILESNTEYTATITTGVQDLAGNALASNVVWHFTTGATVVITPPVVSSTNPVNAAVAVPLNQNIAANFSKTMDATTITAATFTLNDGANSIAGFVYYSGMVAVFEPAANLEAATEYTAMITTGAKDLAGNALAADYSWSFTTGDAIVTTPPTVSSTDPANGAVNVALNQQVAATFSKTMDATTITGATFTIMHGTTPVSGFVSYSGTTALFSPASILVSNTEYTATLTTGARDLAGNALVSNVVWYFTTGATVVITPPVVSSTDPADAAVGVPLNQNIAANFSKTMDATTITAATFTINEGANAIAGFVYYSGMTAVFNPSENLTPNTEYTATITTGAEDLANNALAADYSWTFTTGTATVITPPTVSATDPADGAGAVILDKIVSANFSVPMDATTITAATFTLKRGTTPVSGFISYSGSTAFFASASHLTPNIEYTATITTGAQDLAGNALAADYSWSFTTGTATVIVPPTVSSTDPADGEGAVILNKIVSATFSVPMDATTITAATFTIKLGATPVSGFVSYSGSTAFFAPASNLAPNTEYTATITTGAENLAGIALATDYVWDFTTGIEASDGPPEVSMTDPTDVELCVAIDKQITVTFSEAMDAATITTANFTIMKMHGATFVSGTVSYVGVTATFIPQSDLEPSSTYIATITTGVKDAAGTPMADNHVWIFETITPYTVSLSALPLAGGVVSGAGTFNSCDTVTVTAVPNAGYEFVNWTEAGVEVATTAIYEFELAGNTTLVANFAILSYDITLSVNPLPGGSVTGGGNYEFGESVTVEAIPNIGYSFTNWTAAGVEVSTNAAYTFTISEDLALVANFTLNSYNVVLTPDPLLGGSTSGGGPYDHGSSVTIEAVPEIGYSFVNWTENGNEITVDSSYTFIITMDTTLVANFAVDGYIVTLESNPLDGGNLYGADTYAPDDSVTVRTTSKAGYQFINWTENGVEVSTNAIYGFIITADITLVANYELGQTAPVMGTSARFAILSDQAITNVPTSDITGDVGISPGVASDITGFVLTPDVSLEFSTTPEVTGQVFAADYAVPTPQMLIDAKDDAEVAYLDAVDAARLNPVNLEGNLNGLTLYPGLYESGSSYEISPGGFVYLDAMGDSNAVFVIRSSTSITTESSSEVVLAGNAQAKNIYWVAGSTITLGTTSIMKGTLIASTSISLLTGATLEGRALIQGAAAGQVSLDQATIVLPQ